MFGDSNNLYNILADFLKAVTTDLQNYELETITLRNTHVLPNLQDDKFCVLDVMVELNSRKLIDIEIQVIDRQNMEKRTCFYWLRLISSQLPTGVVIKLLSQRSRLLLRNIIGLKTDKIIIICIDFLTKITIHLLVIR